jgi:uncharacterized membrane protein
MTDLIIEVVGWIGMILVLLAYLLITMKKVKRDSIVYHGMNLVGALMLGINTFINGAYPSTALNTIWIIIAIYGLVQGFKIFKK